MLETVIRREGRSAKAQEAIFSASAPQRLHLALCSSFSLSYQDLKCDVESHALKQQQGCQKDFEQVLRY